MRQQINLFQDVLVDRQEPLRPRQAGLILAAFSCLLILLGLLSYWQMQDEQEVLRVLAHQKNEMLGQIEELEKAYPEQKKDPRLEEQVAQAKALLRSQKQVLAYFSANERKETVSVPLVLEELARQPAPGVWLRHISLDAAGGNIALAGSALRPELVPQYIQFLGEKSLLGRQVFSRLLVTAVDERPRQVDFSLESVTERQ